MATTMGTWLPSPSMHTACPYTNRSIINYDVDARLSRFCCGWWRPHRNRKTPPLAVPWDATAVCCSSGMHCTIEIFKGTPRFPVYCRFGESFTSPRIHFNEFSSHATHCMQNAEDFCRVNGSSRLLRLLSLCPLIEWTAHTHADISSYHSESHGGFYYRSYSVQSLFPGWHPSLAREAILSALLNSCEGACTYPNTGRFHPSRPSHSSFASHYLLWKWWSHWQISSDSKTCPTLSAVSEPISIHLRQN